tara:strand:+ start:1412 stop:1732 length:321 start_codon:yes stop_codon:yes gene_type:complete
MKKIALISILILILITSLIKNSTKEIEDKIFTLKENIRSLEVEFSDVMLEYNYLSSPEKLIQHQYQYFENDLIKTDVTEIKKIYIKHNNLTIIDLVDSNQTNEQTE